MGWGMPAGRWGGVAVSCPSGPRASRPRGPPGDEPGTAGPGWPGRWPPSSQCRSWWPSDQARAGHSRGRHSRRRGRPGAALGRGDDPAGPAHVQRLAGGPPRHGATRSGRPAAARPGRPRPEAPPGLRAVALGGWRLTRTRVRPGHSQPPTPSGGQGPAHPGSPPTAPGRPPRLSSSTSTPCSWGGRRRSRGWPPSRARRASSTRASARR
jgi:hypothetical protein